MPNFSILTEEDKAALLGQPTAQEDSDLLSDLQEYGAAVELWNDGRCHVKLFKHLRHGRNDDSVQVQLVAVSFGAAAKAALAIKEILETVNGSRENEEPMPLNVVGGAERK